jgi:hypothetical protein
MATTAWIVPVWRDIEGIGHTLMMYVAGFEKADDARRAVIEHLGGGEVDVRDAASISTETTKSLRIANGQVTLL